MSLNPNSAADLLCDLEQCKPLFKTVPLFPPLKNGDNGIILLGHLLGASLAPNGASQVGKRGQSSNRQGWQGSYEAHRRVNTGLRNPFHRPKLPNWRRFFFYPRGHLAMSGDIFGCHTGGMLASNGLRPGMPLNALQCTGQTPPKKDYPTQNVDSAEVEKPRSRPMRAFRASESSSVKWEDKVITTWADFHRVRAFQAPKPTMCPEGAMNNRGPPGGSVLP